MDAPSWNYASGLTVTLQGRVLQWENNRRGDESGMEQSVADFIARGPAVGYRDLEKSTLREMLAALGNPQVSWLAAEGREKTVTLEVLGSPVRFVDDQYLEAHDDLGVKDIVMRMGKSPQEFWQTKKLHSGYLAEDSTVRGICFKGGTELILHENGNIFLGNLATDATIDDLPLAAGCTAVFFRDGRLEAGTLARPIKIGKLTFMGRIQFFGNGKINSADLAKPAVVGGVRCGVGGIVFKENGAIFSHR